MFKFSQIAKLDDISSKVLYLMEIEKSNLSLNYLKRKH